MPSVKKIVTTLIASCIIALSFSSTVFATEITPDDSNNYVYIGSGVTDDGIAYDVYEVATTSKIIGGKSIVTPNAVYSEYVTRIYQFYNEPLPPLQVYRTEQRDFGTISGILYYQSMYIYNNVTTVTYAGYLNGTL